MPSSPSQRIRGDVLESIRGLLLFDDRPFSGTAYFKNEVGVIERVDLIENGVRSSESADVLSLLAGEIRVDEDYFDPGSETGRKMYDGKPFSGVGYLFEDEGWCTGETVYERGGECLRGSRSWYISGALESEYREDEYLEWFESGMLQTRRVSGDTLFKIVLDASGAVRNVIKHQTEPVSLDRISRLVVARSVTFRGHGVDIPFLSSFIDEEIVDEVRVLSIQESSINIDLDTVLRRLRSLERIELRDNPGILKDDARALKAEWDHLEIVVDDETIRLAS